VAALRRGPAIICTRHGGERMRLQPGGPSRSLKNLLQEAGVPLWERPVMPLLWCGDELVWVPAVGVAAAFRCAPGEDGWLPTWVGR
jgi:tRNA(Ile)-lysidine synthase